MDSALAWIGQVAEWFGQFIPRRTVLDSTEAAVKWVSGHDPILCPPGTCPWWWPWTSKIECFPIARQTDGIETQTLETKDGKNFIVNGTLTYEVTDLLKLLTSVHSAVTAIAEIATSALNDVLCKMTWDEIQDEQRKGTLKTKLRAAAAKELDEYGIKVIRFKLNSLARCRVLKVSQSIAAEER